MKKLLILTMILSTILITSCKNDEQIIDNQSLMGGYIINYSLSFGFCVGPCIREMNFVDDVNTFTILFTKGRGGTGGTPEEYKEKISQKLGNEIVQNIDFEAFMKLDERIGCPDCADGGAESVEIIKGDKKHKVVFEFGKSPKEIEKLVEILREKRVYFEKKYLK